MKMEQAITIAFLQADLGPLTKQVGAGVRVSNDPLTAGPNTTALWIGSVPVVSVGHAKRMGPTDRRWVRVECPATILTPAVRDRIKAALTAVDPDVTVAIKAGALRISQLARGQHLAQTIELTRHTPAQSFALWVPARPPAPEAPEAP